MTAKEFYDHITAHMSAEEALMKLIEGHLRTYESLKFVENEEIHPIMVASMAALDMGWGMAIPDGKDDEEVQGMMIGTEEYIAEMLEKKPVPKKKPARKPAAKKPVAKKKKS